MLLNTFAFEYFFHAFETPFRVFEWPPVDLPTLKSNIRNIVDYLRGIAKTCRVYVRKKVYVD